MEGVLNLSTRRDNQENRLNDFDLDFPIDKSLEDFEYLYRCGNHKSEVERHYFLPDDYLIFYPKVFVFDNSIRELFDSTKNIFQLKMDEFNEYSEPSGKKIIFEYYQIQKKDMDVFKLRYDNATFYHVLCKKNNLDENNYFREYVAPNKDEDNYEYCKLAIESQIYQSEALGKTTNAQIRKKYEIIHQFTDEELDKFDSFILENDD
jgi:hypothetical protein